MATLRIPHGSSPEIPFTVRQTKGGSPMDLTGKPVAVASTNLPFNVTAAVVDPVQGLCRLLFPDTASAQLNKSYSMRLRVGFPGAAGTFTTPLFEVLFT